MSDCKGYQYEPEYNEDELSTSNENTAHSDENDRKHDKNWCSCEHCEILSSRRECTCCREFEHYAENYLSPACPCITEHCDFDMVCLNTIVLETAYVAFMRYKRQGGWAPQVLTNK